jgi:chromosome partitioning protein
MIKYYTFENYGKLKGVDRTTVSKWASHRQVKTIKITEKIPNLVYENVNEEPSIISLMNLKGGCGKTTIAVHLAVLLSILDYKVLLIDTDHQNQCRLFFPEQPSEYTLKDALEKTVSIQDCIYQTKTKSSVLDIIYSDYGIALLELKSMDLLKTLIEPIKQQYDYIIVDTSPNFDMLARNVARMSSHIIIPMIPAALHIDGMIHNFKGLENICNIDVEKTVIGIIFNMVKQTHSQHNYHINNMNSNYPGLTFHNNIPDSADLSKISEFFTNIFDYKSKSKGSVAMKRFIWEVLQRL